MSFTASDWTDALGNQQAPVINAPITELVNFDGFFVDPALTPTTTSHFPAADFQLTLLEHGPLTDLSIGNISDVCDIEITIGNPAFHTMHVSFNFRSEGIAGVPTGNVVAQLEAASNFFALNYGDLGGVFNITLISNTGGGNAAPDGGSTVMLLGFALAGLGFIRRTILGR